MRVSLKKRAKRRKGIGFIELGVTQTGGVREGGAIYLA